MARWGMMRNMSKNGSTARAVGGTSKRRQTGQTLDLERYVPPSSRHRQQAVA